ncbi:MAG: apolipoprotein N-acyltransferase [Gammaproteobacteria bacterium]|nr:apolipoprotein N-acyltransferase [Gammaproteobacteria bacterium]
MLSYLQEPGRYRSAALAALGGLIYPLAFAPYGWYPLLPVALGLLLMSLHGQSAARAARRGFLFGFIAFLTGIYWITISVHTFGGAPLWLAVLLMLSLVAYMAAYTALLAWLLARWCPDENAWRWFIAFPGLWMLLEWVRGWLLSGFGWLAPGYAMTDSPLLGYFPVIGVMGVGWIVALTAAVLVALLVKPTRGVAMGLAGVIVLWIAGGLLGTHQWTHSTGRPLQATMVQGAVPQDQKWLPESLQPTIDLYMNLTTDYLDSGLVIWPEAAIPRYRHLLGGLWLELERLGRTTDTDFLVGTIESNAEYTERFNTVSAFGERRQNYVKRHLVPFGEYFPVPGFIKNQMRLMNLPYQNFSPGEDGQPPLELRGQKISVSICYEDVFGAEMLDTVAASTLLVNVSNDAWFGGSLAPHQHLQIARVRAAEVGRSMLRSTNNGITAVIDPRGRIVARAPQFEAAVLTATVQGRTGMTPYMRWGDWPVVVLSVLCAVITFSRRR